MTINEQNARRIGIYFFYDPQGVVDNYVFYFLDDLCRHLEELYIVCNGAVQKRHLEQLRQYTPHVIVRENTGLDVGAYHNGLREIGFDRLKEFDELLLVNFTIFGPLYPLSEMFESMSARDLDFWGITSHGEARRSQTEALLPHIQSHFTAIRKPMLQSPIFQKYWEELPEIKTYEESVLRHEAVFTKRFESLGFRWATYTGTEDMTSISPNPIMTTPLLLVRDRRCPIIKRRSFFQDYGSLLYDTNGNPAREAFDYIRTHLNYPVDLMWENLLRTCNHSALRRCLELNYILPDQFELPSPNPLPKAALWLHLYYIDLAEQCRMYAGNMPEGTDIIISTDTVEKKAAIEAEFSSLATHRVTVIQIENRGRDNSALLVGFAPYLEQYDVVCFAHDKKVRHLEYETQGMTFSEHCYQNVLKSKHFVKNVLNAFSENSRLGLLVPPPPYASVYYNTLGISDWGPNYENTEELHHRLGLTVPISRELDPVAPFGSVFWFRTSALKRLFAYGWRYEDFPAEPVDFDGTFLHALERIYPFVAQQDGYYSAWLLSNSFAATELTNYHYMLRELNCRLVPLCGSGDFQELCVCAEKLSPVSWRVLYLPLKRWLKSHLSERRFYQLQKIKKWIFHEK